MTRRFQVLVNIPEQKQPTRYQPMEGWDALALMEKLTARGCEVIGAYTVGNGCEELIDLESMREIYTDDWR
jgi:hypothetical protein